MPESLETVNSLPRTQMSDRIAKCMDVKLSILWMVLQNY